jgi:hypothetical protein
MTFLLQLLKFWKEALIVILLGSTWYFYQDTGILQEKLRISQELVQTTQISLKDAERQLEIQHQATEEQVKAQKEAEQKRLTIISNLSSQVNSLRRQAPPQDCTKAIQWSIQQKDELSWPK